MKALTIHAPWAWAIVHGHKRVENRTWRTSHRGPLAIHAGLSDASDGAAAALFRELGIKPPPDWSALRGRVLGVVELIDVVDGARPLLLDPAETFGPWWSGPVGWVIDDVRRLIAPLEATGAQGLWELEEAKLDGTA